eukprot:Rhum_TRINITY_DN13321_c0_g3::Rhum_TRINITY_DN13321_c0_g3_i1::g.59187::m.59187
MPQLENAHSLSLGWYGMIMPLPGICLRAGEQDLKWVLDTGSTHSVLTLRAAVKLGWRHCSARVRKVHYAAAAVPGAHTERRSAVAVPPLTTTAPSSRVVAFPTEVTVAGQSSRPPFGTVGVLGTDFLGCHDAVCFLWSRHEVVLLSRPSGSAAAAVTEERQRVCKRVAAAFPRLVRLATPHIFRGIPFISGTVALPCGSVREARIMVDTGCRRSVLLPDAALTHDIGRNAAEATFVGLSGGSGMPASSVIPVTVTLQAASADGDAVVAGKPKAVVHAGVAVHVMELPTLRQHQKRLGMPVLLLGVEALCTRDTFAYSPWSKQAWM